MRGTYLNKHSSYLLVFLFLTCLLVTIPDVFSVGMWLSYDDGIPESSLREDPDSCLLHGQPVHTKYAVSFTNPSGGKRQLLAVSVYIQDNNSIPGEALWLSVWPQASEASKPIDPLLIEPFVWYPSKAGWNPVWLGPFGLWLDPEESFAVAIGWDSPGSTSTVGFDTTPPESGRGWEYVNAFVCDFDPLPEVGNIMIRAYVDDLTLWVTVYDEMFRADELGPTIQVLRTFRDDVLVKNKRTRALVSELYEQHSVELAQILMHNPNIMRRSAALAIKILPTIRMLLDTKEAYISRLRLGESSNLLGDIANLGSPELKSYIKSVQELLADEKALESLGFKLLENGGAKAAPAQQRSSLTTTWGSIKRSIEGQ